MDLGRRTACGPRRGGATVAARQVGREGGAMLGQSSKEAVGVCGYAGGRRGCRRRHSAACGVRVRRVREGSGPRGWKTDFFSLRNS
jgi:hypothetical protein